MPRCDHARCGGGGRCGSPRRRRPYGRSCSRGARASRLRSRCEAQAVRAPQASSGRRDLAQRRQPAVGDGVHAAVDPAQPPGPGAAAGPALAAETTAAGAGATEMTSCCAAAAWPIRSSSGASAGATGTPATAEAPVTLPSAGRFSEPQSRSCRHSAARSGCVGYGSVTIALSRRRRRGPGRARGRCCRRPPPWSSDESSPPAVAAVAAAAVLAAVVVAAAVVARAVVADAVGAVAAVVVEAVVVGAVVGAPASVGTPASSSTLPSPRSLRPAWTSSSPGVRRARSSCPRRC